MAFPSSPTDGQIHSVGDRAFQWNATLGAWKRYANNGTINWQQYKFSTIQDRIAYYGSENPKDIGLSCTMTPSSVSNKVLIMANLCGHLITPGAKQWVVLLRDGNVLSYLNKVYEETPTTMGIYMDQPSSLSPVTYSIKLLIEGIPTDIGQINYGTDSGSVSSFVRSSLLIAELKA